MDLYNVILWNGTHKAAEPRLQQAFPLEATYDYPQSLEEGITAMIEIAELQGWEATLSVGATYGLTQQHTAKNWQAANAILLEWDAHQSEAVIDALERLNVRAVLFNSSPKRVAYAIPLDMKLTTQKEYSRVASLLLADIKLSLASDGCAAVTFLVTAMQDGLVYDNDLRVLDAECELARKEWVTASDWTAKATAKTAATAPAI